MPIGRTLKALREANQKPVDTWLWYQTLAIESKVVGTDPTLALAIKGLMYQNECTAVAAGLGMVFPTGDDSVVSNPGRTFIVFENSSVFLQPFIGIYSAPTERLFHQFLAQVEFDVSGSDVIVKRPIQPAHSQW